MMTTVCASTTASATGPCGPIGVSSDYFGATGATGPVGPVGLSSDHFGATGTNPLSEHTRDNHLQAISMMYMNGLPFSKLDCLGYISINGTHFVNVFRRYNSPYEIVVEDYVGDFHMFRDISVKETIQRVLCLSDAQMEYFHIKETISFKKSCTIHLSPNTHWSEIHHFHQGVMMDITGLPIYFPITSSLNTPSFVNVPSAPMKESLCPALCSTCVEEISENLFERFNGEYRKRKSTEDDQEQCKHAKIKNEVVNEVVEDFDDEEVDDVEEEENCEEQEEEVESEEEETESEETESEEDTFLCLRGRTIKRN